MHSKITKFTVAAVIIIAVLIGIKQFGGSFDLANPAYALSDVPKSIIKARTIHIQGWFGPDTEGGIRRTPDLDDWIDIQSGRSRTTIFFFGSGTGGKRAKASIRVLNGQYEMELNPNTKRVKYKKLSEFQCRMNARKHIGRFLNSISLTPETHNEYVKIGQKEINNVNCDIWERLTSRTIAGEVFENKTQLWVSADSGKLRRQLGWKKNKHTEGKWVTTWVCEISIDVTYPDDTFKTEPPRGYSDRNTKETAPTPLLRGTLFARANIDQGSIPITLALDDGTVIMAWHLYAISPGSSQAEIISNLEPGAELPKKLSDIMCNLVPEDKTDDTSYTGRHLVHTQKDERIYEWIIFVPNKKTQPQIVQRYMAKSQWFDDGPEETSLRGVEALAVEKHEFHSWVHSAMKELSDDGMAPEGITYQSVQELAEQIRNN